VKILENLKELSRNVKWRGMLFYILVTVALCGTCSTHGEDKEEDSKMGIREIGCEEFICE
jgi:hypothetical protein